MSSFYTNVQPMGDNILVRGVEDGKRFQRRVPFKPKLYTPTQKQTQFKTLSGQPLEQIKFESIADAKEFKSQYGQVENFTLYGDIRDDYAFISEAFPHDIDWDLSHIVIAYIDIEVGSENGFPEPAQANEQVTAITLGVNGRFYAFGCGEYTASRSNVYYVECEDEKDLLRRFLKVWSSNYPDIITGWNITQFDIPYLVNRMERLFLGRSGEGEDILKTLSPWNWIKERHVGKGKDEQVFYDIAGISIIDYIDLYKKYGPGSRQESYKLDYIASVEVGAKKIDYSEYEDLYTLYKRDFQKFIDYNIRDVELVMMIEDKMRLLELTLTLAYDSKTNYEDVFSQVRMWDTIIYNHLKKKGIQLPPKKDTPKREQYEGAYVKNTKPGMYKWVASFDFQSLYPHLIMMYNMSPETLLDQEDYPSDVEEWMDNHRPQITVEGMLAQKFDTAILRKHNLCLTPNKQLFSRERHGFLAELMNDMYEDRAKYKKLMTQAIKEKEAGGTTPDIEKRISRYNNLQQAKKVCLNSAYGAIGNQYFRFFDVRIAEAVTMSAQLSVIWIQQEINKFLNTFLGTKNQDYVVASDTDSIYVTFEAVVNRAYTPTKQAQMGPAEIIKSLDKICQTVIGPEIDKYCQQLADYVNAYDQKLIMKREALANKAIWTAMKHYMINVFNNEGIQYAKPKLKIVGMEAIKSTTPAICRDKLKKAFEIIINEDEKVLRKFIDDFRVEFNAAPVQDIASPSGMNGLNDYAHGEAIFKSKTPFHTKGALVYNWWLNKLNLTKKYPLLKDGEKIKYVYLKEPNTIQSKVISFPNVLPAELGLAKYVDYDKMFHKNFLGQVEPIAEVIGWSLEETSSLEALFG